MLDTKIAELMDFPSLVTFKVVSNNVAGIEDEIKKVLSANKFTDFTITQRESRTNKYKSYSVSLTVASPEQMEKLYVELAQIKDVLMVI